MDIFHYYKRLIYIGEMLQEIDEMIGGCYSCAALINCFNDMFRRFLRAKSFRFRLGKALYEPLYLNYCSPTMTR